MKWYQWLVILFFGIQTSFAGTVFHDHLGNKVLTANWKGKWIIINYWASWCGNCLKEIPELNHFVAENHDKNIILYGVNYDQLAPENLSAAIKSANIKFPVLQEDPNALWNLGSIVAVPMTFIISPKGVVVKSIIGVNTKKSLVDTLESLKQSRV